MKPMKPTALGQLLVVLTPWETVSTDLLVRQRLYSLSGALLSAIAVTITAADTRRHVISE
jgi:hypothetical protein